MEIKNYNPSDVTITVASRAFGTFAITGLGGDNIECSADNDFAEAVTGFQGDVVINESAKRNGTIKVSVQATSPQLKVLKRMADVTDIFSVWVVNKATNEKTGGSKAFMKKPADNKVGEKLADREFEIQVLDYTDR